MRRAIIILVLVVYLICFSCFSFVSADTAITFSQQINPVYNLGDTIAVPVTIKSPNELNGMFQMDLLCNGSSINFYKNGISLVAGEEKSFDSSLILIKEVIGDMRGACNIKAILGAEYALSSEFRVSDSLIVAGNLEKSEFNPGEIISLKGKVTKETGENSEGFVEMRLVTGDAGQYTTPLGVIHSGEFSINLSLASGIKAGRYVLRVIAFEEDSKGTATNKGIIEYNISINQVPTNLEIILGNKQVMPGESAKIKAILHDQSGEPISSLVSLKIKDKNDKILEQKEVQTGQEIEYSVEEREPPAELKVLAISDKLTAESSFQIQAKEDINVEIVNKTILITNTGNVPYNKTLVVTIGDNPFNILVRLAVGESKKYVLTAPDGEYQVEVKTDAGEEASGIMSLTGRAIDIRETSGGHYTPLAWILMIAILGFIVFNIFRKIYKKPFIGKKMDFPFKSFKKREEEMPVLGERSISMPANKAELSLSIKGEKQEASVICLKIKNLREMKLARGSAAESIQKAVNLAEDNKAASYENQDYLFFIFAPLKTRTFKNEKTALEIAKEMQRIFEEHNKMFSQKIEFGISLDYGTIVAKIEDGIFKFMTMGTLMTSAKKIASLSRGEVLLGERMNDLLRLNIKTDRQIREGMSVFSVREIKKENEEAKKFIERFMRRQQEGNQ